MSGELTGRRCGITFAHCHDVAAAVALEQFRTVFMVLEVYRDIDHIRPMLYAVLWEYGLALAKVLPGQYEYLAGLPNTRLRFVTLSDMPHVMQGQKDAAIVYFARDRYETGHNFYWEWKEAVLDECRRPLGNFAQEYEGSWVPRDIGGFLVDK
jgi:hypothetical protein